ncbi:MAG: hypothetical protein V5A23_01245 [Halobacteriales archaeon]
MRLTDLLGRRLRDVLGVSERRQRQLTRGMQLTLVGLLFIGLDRGNTGIIVNTAVALGVSELPAVLERDYEIPMDAGLTLWITTAVFLHALGTVGLPGSETSFYRGTFWWDHMTHALSSSVIAGVGYATVRAIDRHSEAIHLPPRFTFVFVLMFVLAFGVFWEVVEFAIGLAAAEFGSAQVLTQYGLSDTMWDLVYNTIGGVVVAAWGTAYLTDVAGAIQRKLEGNRAGGKS